MVSRHGDAVQRRDVHRFVGFLWLDIIQNFGFFLFLFPLCPLLQWLPFFVSPQCVSWVCLCSCLHWLHQWRIIGGSSIGGGGVRWQQRRIYRPMLSQM
jgi:hypothetical protein